MPEAINFKPAEATGEGATGLPPAGDQASLDGMPAPLPGTELPTELTGEPTAEVAVEAEADAPAPIAEPIVPPTDAEGADGEVAARRGIKGIFSRPSLQDAGVLRVSDSQRAQDIARDAGGNSAQAMADSQGLSPTARQRVGQITSDRDLVGPAS